MKNKVINIGRNDLRSIIIITILNDMANLLNSIFKPNPLKIHIISDNQIDSALNTIIHNLARVEPRTLTNEHVKSMDKIFLQYAEVLSISPEDNTNRANFPKLAKVIDRLADIRGAIPALAVVPEAFLNNTPINLHTTTPEKNNQIFDNINDTKRKELDQKLTKIIEEYIRIISSVHIY